VQASSHEDVPGAEAATPASMGEQHQPAGPGRSLKVAWKAQIANGDFHVSSAPSSANANIAPLGGAGKLGESLGACAEWRRLLDEIPRPVRRSVGKGRPLVGFGGFRAG
jgi:hypothetical protein